MLEAVKVLSEEGVKVDLAPDAYIKLVIVAVVATALSVLVAISIKKMLA